MKNIANVLHCHKRMMIGLLFCCLQQVQAQPPNAPVYLDYTKPVDERVHDLMSQMTVEEKATYLNHVAPDIERFNIKSDKWNQCLHGVVWNRPTTMFPVSIAAAATFDTKLINEVATAISDEARAIYNGWHNDPAFEGDKKGLIYRAPVINMSRNPYWGRINECFGEDPYLTGRIGVAYVKGLQGNDPKHLKLVATLKHYAVNNVEENRQALSATVSERMLHEYWLPQFRDCIVDGQAQSIMASYNAINGTPNNINQLLLTDILKKDWGFKGFVVSDLGGVRTMVTGHEKGQMSYEEAVARSLIAGCDFSDKEFMQYIPNAVKQGLLPEARLNDAVYRVMRDRFLLGEFDPPQQVLYSNIPMSVIGNEVHRKLALQEAQESIVLLTNKNKTLPLDKNEIKTIAVIGPHADVFTAGGYSGKPMETITPLQGIENRVAPQTKVLFAKGCLLPPVRRRRNDTTNVAAPIFDTARELQNAVAAAKQADAVVLYLGTTLDVEAEGFDRKDLGLPAGQRELFEKVIAANPRTIVVLMNAGPLTIPSVKEKAPAIIEAWWGGEQGANAIADVVFGNVNPAGRLPYTVYASPSQIPPQDEYDITKGFTYMYIHGNPLFAFGHGLSYTSFKYADLKLSDNQLNKSGNVTVSVKVTNTGKLAGDEVVQLYVHDIVASVKRPVKELRGFERITLNPGQTQTVTFNLPFEKLAFYDEQSHGFKVEPGDFDLMVGSSSDDIRLQTKLTVK